MNSAPKTNQESLILSVKKLLFTSFSLVAIVSFLSLTVSCGDDDNNGPTGPSMEGNVLISGGGASTEFEDFTFSAFGLSVFVSSIKGADTLLIGIVNLDSISVNSPIDLDDGVFEGGPLLIFATFGAVEYTLINGESPVTSGSLTFTTLDTNQSIAGSFSDGASIFATKSDFSDKSFFGASIEGNFSASKRVVPLALAKRISVLSGIFRHLLLPPPGR